MVKDYNLLKLLLVVLRFKTHRHSSVFSADKTFAVYVRIFCIFAIFFPIMSNPFGVSITVNGIIRMPISNSDLTVTRI